MRSPRLLLLAGILGSTGVALGAFGAHALKERLALAAMTEVWNKAVLYQLVHSVALLAIHKSDTTTQPARWLARAGACWFWGVLCFSGSLYGLALGGPRLLGPITPLGGILLIAGWISVIVASRTSSPENTAP